MSRNQFNSDLADNIAQFKKAVAKANGAFEVLFDLQCDAEDLQKIASKRRNVSAKDRAKLEVLVNLDVDGIMCALLELELDLADDEIAFGA